MSFIRLFLIVALAGACPCLHAATSNVVFSITGAWRYTTNNLDGVNWTAANYNDSAWSGPGNALLFIETAALPAPKNTALPTNSAGRPMPCYYFRTTFNLTNKAALSLLLFSNLVDDGAVFYLNGAEVQRIRMTNNPVIYTSLASALPLGGDATAFENFVLSGNVLTHVLEGSNVLAAEVHQQATTSSDIVFGSSVTAIYGLSTNVTRGPYLQLSTPGSIVIRWRTDVASDTRVDYGTNPAALNLSMSDPASTNEHIVTLGSLEPDTRHYYAVGTSARLLAGPDAEQYFLTHPLPGTAKPVRVWVIGDAGTTPYGAAQAADQQAVRDAFYNFNGTNLVHAWLQLGDNAYDSGTDDQYQAAVFDVYSGLLKHCVTWPTLGNHETVQSTVYSDNYPYFSIFTLPTNGAAGGVPSATEHYYSFDLGMVHFICLDSMTADRSTNGAMATWLRSDLGVTTNRWLVAYWHHPPYSKGSHDSDAGGPGYDIQMGEMRTNFLPILEAGGVDLVLCGHSHAYERSYFINGHYGVSSTFGTNLVVQSGSGRVTNGVGAYLKPDGLGERPIGNRGAIYAVAGSSGQTSGGALNHPAMFFSTNALGSMVLDFQSNRLDAAFIRENGITNDWFCIVKEGTYPPRLSGPAFLPGGGLGFIVLTRAYRTNILEESTNLSGSWKAVLTNIPSTSEVSLTYTNTGYHAQDFYRVKRP